MAYHDVQFPQAIAESAHGGPVFNTSVNETAAGYEQRNVNWSLARHKYDVSYGIKTRVDAEVVVDFFYARMGRAHSFRFKDWRDYSIDTAGTPMSIGVGDGINLLFQAVKVYASGSNVYIRKITRLVAGSASVYVGGVLKTIATDYTLGSTGLITFAVAPANGVIVGLLAHFDVPARFDDDYLDTSIIRPDIMEVPSIVLREVRE